MSTGTRYGILAALGVAGLVVIVVLLSVSPMFDRRVQVSPLKPATNVTGQIVCDGAPVSGVRIRTLGHREFVTTDAEGRFSIPNAGKDTALAASKWGFLIAPFRGESAGTPIALRKLADTDFEDYAWRSPTPAVPANENCGSCHQAIYSEWVQSGHARSAIGLRFRNLYEGTHASGRPDVGWNLVKERPDGIGVCAACHAPTSGPNAESGYDLRAEFAKAGPGKPTEREPGLSGVHCDYCHKIVGPAEGHIGRTHGRYGLTLRRPERGQVVFGPFEDSTRADNAHAPFQRDSRYCASCHEGTVLGVPVYTTYSEWQASPAGKKGKQCQECHLDPTGLMTNMAPEHGGIERDPTTLANHRFVLGSRLRMLQHGLKVVVHRGDWRAEGVRLGLEVLADDVGHQVPTGFVDRNLVIVIEALDEGGRTLAPLKGDTLPAIAGKTESGKAGRLYAKRLTGFDGQSPVPFWRAKPEVVDTRLLPGKLDVSEWLFPAATRTLTVRVLHRRFWPATAESKGWTDNELVIQEWTDAVAPPTANPGPGP